ncbi:MAG TPA: RNA ligase family protein, partial [Nannocystaceae bacterium]|nr:RNA ligase family protein [Nannocystaceae bacterium]
QDLRLYRRPSYPLVNVDEHVHARRRPLEGSRFPRGGDDPSTVAFAHLLGRRIVAREKLDGHDARLWCDGGELRVHGPEPLAGWASHQRAALHAALGERWELHGVWLQTKRVAFYDALPQWFVALDVFDRERGVFVSAGRRTELFAAVDLAWAPIVHEGPVRSLKAVHALVGPSRCKTARWRESLRDAARRAGLDVARIVLATDPHDDATGLHIDIDEGDVVDVRLEFVRATFGSAVLESDDALANALAAAP